MGVGREGGGMELHTSCAHCMELQSNMSRGHNLSGPLEPVSGNTSLCTYYTIIITRNNVDKQGENLHVDITMLLSTHL